MNEPIRRLVWKRRVVLLATLVLVLIAALTASPAGASTSQSSSPTIAQGCPIPPFCTPATLQVNLAGTGGGQVASSEGTPVISCSRTGGVNTPASCTGDYQYLFFPFSPTLTASAAAGSTFAGWVVSPSGAAIAGCGLNITCQLNMSGNVTVTPTFTAAPGTQPLSVLKAGAGQGTVTSAPAGINCGLDCSESFTTGSVITLTATPNPGSTFAGYSGACTGNTCVVTMNAALSVTATFNTQTFPLTVTLAGPANSGGVSSNPAGIACQPLCTANYPAGTSVTLTAVAASNATFQGWSGAGCSGTGTCIVPMNAAQSVTATFASSGPPPPPPGVDAEVVNKKVVKNAAGRKINVDINADERVSIVMRIRRNGVTIATRNIRNFPPGERIKSFPIRPGIGGGPARLVVVFTNNAGNTKTQSFGIRIPAP